MEFTFSEHLLDVERRELRRAGVLVALEPQVFDLLLFLLRNRDRVVARDDLLEAVWSGRIVSEQALTTRINAVRKAVGDDGRAQRLIRTVPRRGFRFIGEVREAEKPATPVAARAISPSAPPETPSIAVLPFADLTSERDQRHFADGVVEEIITALSHIRWLFVIARSSTDAYKGQAVDIRQIGRELGARYVLEGSVRSAESRMRVTAQLIDAANGAHLWADHFDGSLADIFELQDRVAASVAGAIEPALQAAEIRRSEDRPAEELTAYDLYLRARAAAQSWEQPRVLAALDLLRRALDRDPLYGPALSLAAKCHANLYVAGWTDAPEKARRDGIELARRALGAAGDDPYILSNAAYVLGQFGEDIDAALSLIDRSLQLNPSFARAWLRSGWLRLWAGYPDVAIEHFETSIRLSPRESTAPACLGIGAGHFFSRRFPEARTMLLSSLQEIRGWAPTYRFLAACYAHMGQPEKAREVVERLRGVTSQLIPSATHWRDPEHRELFLSGLRAAVGEPPRCSGQPSSTAQGCAMISG